MLAVRERKSYTERHFALCQCRANVRPNERRGRPKRHTWGVHFPTMTLNELIDHVERLGLPIARARDADAGTYARLYSLAQANNLDPNKLAPICNLPSVFPDRGGNKPETIGLKSAKEVPIKDDRAGRWAGTRKRECGLHV